jgi:hypothetical protein
VKSKERLLNYQTIVYSGNDKIIQVDADAIAWGKQVIRGLNLENLFDFEKAQKISTFLAENFTYNFGRSMSIREIIKKKGGNCVSHTLMGIFLLRLAGIPAKFAHEVHILKQYRLTSLYVGLWAKKNNSGINSFWHNDHVWVWFKNDGNWEPFDSALDVCGFDQFYAKRFLQHNELSEGFAQKWAGPPFVIWEGVGDGFVGMKNITPAVINQDALRSLKHREKWFDFVALFSNWKRDDFYNAYLPENLICRIRAISVRWFSE